MVRLIRLVLGWLLIAALLGAGTALAARLPLLQDPLGTDSARKDLPLPKPTELQPGWWHYFDGADPELTARVTATLTDVADLVGRLPPQTGKEAQSYAELIKANLATLPLARAQESPELPALPAYNDRYTLAELIALADKLRDTHMGLEAAAADVNAAEEALTSATRANDTRFAAYLDLPASDPQRVLQGLQIMAERAALLIEEERLRVRKAEREALKADARQLGDVVAAAKQRLTVEWLDAVRLDAAMTQTEVELAQAHAAVVQAKAQASGVVGNDPQDKATEQYRQQGVINALVAEGSAKVKLLTLRAEQQLARLLADDSRLQIEQLRALLAQNRTALTVIEQELAAWINASERERQRASAASGAADGAAASRYQERLALAQETLLATQKLRAQIARSQLVMQLVDERLVQQEGWLSNGLARLQQGAQMLWQNAARWVNASLFTIGDTPVTAWGILRIALILTFAWLLSHWLRRALTKLGARGDDNYQSGFYTIGRLSHYLIILLGFLIGLSSIGMDFTSFALVAGALAIGIGFGLQAIVNNFISGLILLFERSLKVGDFIELANGVTGEVKAINVRSTLIKTNENIDIVVPNSEFMNSNVINWTLQEPYRRVHYPFRVAFGADKDLVRKAGLEAAEKVTHTLSGIPGKNPQVWLVGFGDNGYSFELVVWLTPSAVKRPSGVRAAYYWELETALKKYHIEVPIPQRDLYLRGGFEALRSADSSEQSSTTSPDVRPGSLTPLRRSPGA